MLQMPKFRPQILKMVIVLQSQHFFGMIPDGFSILFFIINNTL